MVKAVCLGKTVFLTVTPCFIFLGLCNSPSAVINNPTGRILNFGPFWEPDMIGCIVPYMEPPISTSANMEAAFGRLHCCGPQQWTARLVIPHMVQYILPYLTPKMVRN